MNIRTTYVYPPIPIRDFDWSAVDDDTYEPGCPIGTGRTEQAAIADLLQQIEENSDGQATAPTAQPTEPQREPISYSDINERYQLDCNSGMREE